MLWNFDADGFIERNVSGWRHIHEKILHSI